MTRPFHIAHADWKAISQELHTRSLIHREKPTEANKLARLAAQDIDVRKETTTRTTVSSKWMFIR